MEHAIDLSPQAARRFVLGKQGLWPGRRWHGKDGTRSAVRAVEHLQLDPLRILARSHDLMLHSRVAGYRAEFFDELHYEDRAFFDWGGWLTVMPMEELPYWRVIMRRHRDHPAMRTIAENHAAMISEMRDALQSGLMLSSRDFKRGERDAVLSYRGLKDSSVALYYLWRTGEAMTHHRNGFERVYAATSAVAPPDLLTEESDEAADRHLVLKSIAFAGIGRIAALGRTLARAVSKAEERAIQASLVDDGALVPVKVEGWRGTHFALTSDLDALREVRSGHIPAGWAPLDATTTDEVTFLSPLDPVSARGRAREIFGFEYVWEIYKRADDMRFGRYTMPMLWRDALVGRIDMRLDRPASTLVVNGAWLEEEALGGDPAFLDALRAGLRRLRLFLSADQVDVTQVTDPLLSDGLLGLVPG